ncbi:MAG: hypothetical protein ACTH2Q_13410 [Propionibacteriaceae bacterium]
MTGTDVGTAEQDAIATQPPRRRLLLNCVVAAVAAVTAMIMVHEAVHLLTGAALGYPSTMYAFGVIHTGDPTAGHDAAMGLSAPAFSLVSGLVLALWLPLRRRGGFAHLAWLLFAFASMQEGIAYLCLTPFGVGDTGAAATALGLPVWVKVAACLLGVGGMFVTARMFATHLARHAGPDHGDRNAFSLFTWLYGMLILTALTIGYLAITPMELSPGEQIAILTANTAILVFAPMANIFHRQVADVPHEPLALPRIPVAGFVAVGVLLVINIGLSSGVLTLG